MAIGTWPGWMAHLPSKPSALACERRPPVALGVLVGGIGRVDGVDHGGPRRGEHLDPGEVPEVARVGDDRVEVAVDPGVQRRREVAGAEDQRLERGRSPARSRARWPAPRPPRSGPRGRWAAPGRASPRAGRAARRPTRRRGRAAPWARSARRAQSRAPVTTSMMSPWHHGVSMPLIRTARTVRPQSSPVERARPRSPGPTPWPPARRRPRGRGTRGRPPPTAPSRTCARCWPAWPARNGGLGVRARCLLRPRLRWCRPPAARPGARRRGRAGRRRPRRCPRPGPGPGGRPRPASRSRRATGACTVIGPEVGVVHLDERAPGPQVLVGQQLLRRRRRAPPPPRPARTRHRPRPGSARAIQPGDELVDLDGACLAPHRVGVVGVRPPGRTGRWRGTRAPRCSATRSRWRPTCRRRSR